LDSVELSHAAGHEEAFNEPKKRRNAGPEEAQVEDSQSRAAQIKVVDSERAQEERQQDADNLIAAH
jgi:hypothetical protein